MSKNKQDFITDFLFEVNGQFHQPDYDMLDSFYDLLQKEYEEKLRWTHVFEELPDLNSVIELKSEDKRFLGIVKLKNYQGENRYYVQGMYQATGDIDILYNFSHWRKAIL